MKPLTATEQKIYDRLAPGHPVTIQDLIAATGDPHTEPVTVQMHLSNIRDKISSNGLFVLNADRTYRLVVALNRNHE